MKLPETNSVHLEGALPCPFCGGGRIVKGERYFALCVDCGATGPERNADASQKKFTGDWNSRAGLSIEGNLYEWNDVKKQWDRLIKCHVPESLLSQKPTP